MSRQECRMARIVFFSSIPEIAERLVLNGIEMAMLG